MLIGPGAGAGRTRASIRPSLLKPLARLVADLLRRLHRPPVQRADAGQPDDGQEPDAGVDQHAVATGPAAAAEGGRGGGAAAPIIIGGARHRGSSRRWRGQRQGLDPPGQRHALRHGARITCGPSMRNDGRELWHYFWKTRGGTHIGNRGAAIWHNYLFFETPDNYLVSLDARTGKERWHVEIADFDEQYFSTPAPIIVDNHVLVGTGNDLDMPGFLQSFDAGDRQARVEVLHGADEARRSRARHVAEPRRGAPRRRPGLGARRRTTRRPVSTSSAPAIRRPATPAWRARATTCSPARSSRSTSTPARWRGTSRPRRTTRTTGTRRRRRS